MIYVMFYLVGYVTSYLLYKRTFKKRFNEWLVSDRFSALGTSFFSWITVAAILLVNVTAYLDKNGDQPAKW